MYFNEMDLFLAQKEGVISSDELAKLYEFLIKNCQNEKREIQKTEIRNNFNANNLLYYIGGFMIILAMGWFLGIIWKNALALFFATLIFSGIFFWWAQKLWSENLKTASSLLYTCFVSSMPLLVYSFENLFGLFDKSSVLYKDFHFLVRSGWISMELAAIIVGFYLLNLRKKSIIALPVAFSLWYFSMDIVPLFAGNFLEPTWGQRNFASFAISLAMMFFAYYSDKKQENCSFWFWLFGASIFWGTICSIFGEFKMLDNEFVLFLLFLFSILYMFISVYLRKKIFMVFGAAGFIAYLFHLAHTIFHNSPVYPIVIIFLGFGVIFAGIWCSKNPDKLKDHLKLPY